MQNSKTILFTNEIAETAVAYSHSLGLNVLVAPMIQTILKTSEFEAIQHIAAADNSEAWIFTSKNAVDVFLQLKNKLPDYKRKHFFSAGSKTAAKLKAAGIEVIVPEKESTAALAELIVAKNITSVLFWCGNLRRDVLPDFLKSKNIALKELRVYDTLPQPKTVTSHYDAVAFLSSSAAESFFSANKIATDIPLFAIGETTFQTLKKLTENNIYVPEKPDVNLLLTLAKKYLP